MKSPSLGIHKIVEGGGKSLVELGGCSGCLDDQVVVVNLVDDDPKVFQVVRHLPDISIRWSEQPAELSHTQEPVVKRALRIHACVDVIVEEPWILHFQNDGHGLACGGGPVPPAP